MRLRVDVTPDAWGDVSKAMDYIARDSIDAALRLHEAVNAAFQTLAENPLIGRPIEEDDRKLRGLRKWTVHGFLKYSVYYRVYPDSIEIVGVLHGARDVIRILSDER